LGYTVERIAVDTYDCTGVLLEGGEEINSGAVLSSVDPRRTFISLVQPVNLPPEFVWRTQSIKMRGAVSKLHLLTDGSHGLPAGTLVVAPSIQYLERAYDAAKYGEISEHPFLEVTTSGKVVSVHIQFTPYALKNAEWAAERQRVEDLVVNTLAEHFPSLRSCILQRKLLTPPDRGVYGLQAT
jgi:phytoene dehydrogenase-like protein